MGPRNNPAALLLLRPTRQYTHLHSSRQRRQHLLHKPGHSPETSPPCPQMDQTISHHLRQQHQIPVHRLRLLRTRHRKSRYRPQRPRYSSLSLRPHGARLRSPLRPSWSRHRPLHWRTAHLQGNPTPKDKTLPPRPRQPTPTPAIAYLDPHLCSHQLRHPTHCTSLTHTTLNTYLSSNDPGCPMAP